MPPDLIDDLKSREGGVEDFEPSEEPFARVELSDDDDDDDEPSVDPDDDDDEGLSRKERRKRRGFLRQENERLRGELERRERAELETRERLARIEGAMIANGPPEGPKPPDLSGQINALTEKMETLQANYAAAARSGAVDEKMARAMQSDWQKLADERTRLIADDQYARRAFEHEQQQQDAASRSSDAQRAQATIREFLATTYEDVVRDSEALAYADRKYKQLQREDPGLSNGQLMAKSMQAARERFGTGGASRSSSRFSGTGVGAGSGDARPQSMFLSEDEQKMALAAYGNDGVSPKQAYQKYARLKARSERR